jgi:menaquinol-cytochrome c reductase iron-sulfur subunit
VSTVQQRRGFLSLITRCLMSVLGLSLAVPALAYFCGPLWRKPGEEAVGGSLRDVGAIKDLPVGEWRLLSLETVTANGWEKSGARRHSIWVRREAAGDQAISVFSPICPHLGCPINWNEEQAHFLCPCHGGIFNGQGQLLSGPPPRGMDALEFEVRAGRLFVRWQDFKVGVRERVPVKV